MQRNDTRPIFPSSLMRLALALALFCAFAGVGVGQEAPRFTARTLDGSTFTNASLEGRVTLLQFWTTWCPHCRADQPAVDEVDRRFGGRGLVVLAVDEGEPEATVGKYLHEHPRSVPIVLDQNRTIARRFGAHVYPTYVVLDRRGRIAGTQRGEGGEDSLLALLRRAGLRAGSDATQAAQPDSAAGPTPVMANGASGPSGIKMIEVPPERHVRAAKPAPETVFVLRGGERLESDHYTMDRSYLHAVVNGEPRTIAIGDLDVSATEAANRARGVEVKIPNGRGELFVAF
jgi:thiol-disulfide isomerase/thioredoxin